MRRFRVVGCSGELDKDRFLLVCEQLGEVLHARLESGLVVYRTEAVADVAREELVGCFREIGEQVTLNAVEEPPPDPEEAVRRILRGRDTTEQRRRAHSALRHVLEAGGRVKLGALITTVSEGDHVARPPAMAALAAVAEFGASIQAAYPLLVERVRHGALSDSEPAVDALVHAIRQGPKQATAIRAELKRQQVDAKRPDMDRLLAMLDRPVPSYQLHWRSAEGQHGWVDTSRGRLRWHRGPTQRFPYDAGSTDQSFAAFVRDGIKDFLLYETSPDFVPRRVFLELADLIGGGNPPTPTDREDVRLDVRAALASVPPGTTLSDLAGDCETCRTAEGGDWSVLQVHAAPGYGSGPGVARTLLRNERSHWKRCPHCNTPWFLGYSYESNPTGPADEDVWLSKTDWDRVEHELTEACWRGRVPPMVMPHGAWEHAAEPRADDP